MSEGKISPLDQQILQDLSSFVQTPRHADSALQERDYLLDIADAAGEDLANSARLCFGTLLDLQRAYQRDSQGEAPLLTQVNAALESTPAEFPRYGTVACQGCAGAYSQLACDRLLSRGKILYVKTFEGVFQAVEQGLCEYGILPIENSLHGTVGAVYDLMQNYSFHIIRSCKLPVGHALLAPRGVKLAEIKEVISHEQALGQCSNFLRTLPGVKTVVYENTAAAAHFVAASGRRDLAALAAPGCAELYNLDILQDEVQNSAHNFTRFICITKALRIYPGANKISLIAALPHRSGALYHLLGKFAALDLNLTKLESRPIPGKDFEFRFYFDLEASVYSRELKTLLADLSREMERPVLLGCYSEI